MPIATKHQTKAQKRRLITIPKSSSTYAFNRGKFPILAARIDAEGHGRPQRAMAIHPRSVGRGRHILRGWQRGVQRRCERWRSLCVSSGTELNSCSHVAGVGHFQLVEYPVAQSHYYNLTDGTTPIILPSDT